MNLLPCPLLWLEAALLTALVGALVVNRFRDPLAAWRWGLAFTGAVFLCAALASVTYYSAGSAGAVDSWSLEAALAGSVFLEVDELNAPLLPLVALLHFLTALATGRTKMRRFSLSWSLAAAAIRLAIVSCQLPWMLIALLILCAIPPYFELRNRSKPTRVYLLHMGLFAMLLIVGWACLGISSDLAAVPLLLAFLIRCGVVPFHCWLTDWLENASFGNALLFVTPLTSICAVVRLVLPVAPDWVLQAIGIVSTITAVYAAAMGVIQTDVRRYFAYLFLSHASQVLIGLELHTTTSVAGALSLWISVSLSLGGFGLTLRALEARYGRLTLSRFHGLYEHSPALAICFLLTGLAGIGFPGTLGFVATELLFDGVTAASPVAGLALVVAGALNGIGVVRAYFSLFTGARHASTVSLAITARERFAVLTLAAAILGGGLFPQPGIGSRHEAAVAVLQNRPAFQSLSAGEEQLPTRSLALELGPFHEPRSSP